MKPERTLERILFASRWLLFPLYLGLALLLVFFAIQFFHELIHLARDIPTLEESGLVAAALTLVDLTLVGGLVVMVMLAGYENFISKMEIDEAAKSIAWLGKLDTGTLKLKVSATIVAISAVQLLKAYMEIATVPADKLLWLVVIHLSLVVSALLLTIMDRIVGATAQRSSPTGDSVGKSN
jgi:uncharacterized protein (TIGR00645 family)